MSTRFRRYVDKVKDKWKTGRRGSRSDEVPRAFALSTDSQIQLQLEYDVEPFRRNSCIPVKRPPSLKLFEDDEVIPVYLKSFTPPAAKTFGLGAQGRSRSVRVSRELEVAKF